MKRLLAVLLLLASPAGATAPADTGKEIDATATTAAVTQAQETKSVAFDRCILYSTFWGCTGGAGCLAGATGDNGVYMTRYNTQQDSTAADVRVFDNAGVDGAVIPSSAYHELPALAWAGNDLLLFDANATTSTCVATPGQGPPFMRRAPRADVGNPAAYRDPDSTCLPATKADGTSLDLSGVSAGSVLCLDPDPITLSNGSVVLGCKMGGWTGMAGVGQTIYRRSAAGAWRGPFWLLKSASRITLPTGSDNCTGDDVGGLVDHTGARNSFTYGALRERNGVLYNVWTVKNEFQLAASPTVTHYHTYNLYLMKSTDGGITWTDLAGGNSFTAAEEGVGTAPSYDTDVVGNPFPAYLVWQGDLDLGSETQFDVDTAGRPVFVALKNTGGPSLCNRPDNSNPTSTYAPVLVRYTGSYWTETPIDAAGGTSGKNWRSRTVQPIFDALGRIWLLRTGFPTATPATTAYSVTNDAGATWQAWTAFVQDAAPGSNAPQRLSTVLDPSRRWVAMTYSIPPNRILLRKLDLVSVPVKGFRR